MRLAPFRDCDLCGIPMVTKNLPYRFGWKAQNEDGTRDEIWTWQLWTYCPVETCGNHFEKDGRTLEVEKEFQRRGNPPELVVSSVKDEQS
jgi:hypothetical protein